MARVPPKTAEDQALDELDHESQQDIERLAMEAGPPPDAHRLSPADEVQAWTTTDPQVDHEEMAKQLVTQGIDPQLAQNLLIVKLHPDNAQEWIQAYTTPTNDAEHANTLATLALYPFSLSLIEDMDDPEAMVRKAETLDRRAQKHHTTLQEQIAQGMGQSTPGSYAGVHPTSDTAPPAPPMGG